MFDKTFEGTGYFVIEGGRVRIGEAALDESALPFRSVVH
jgi:hypothetical protein